MDMEPSTSLQEYFGTTIRQMTSNAPVTAKLPVLHLYKTFSDEFSLLSRWSVPDLHMDLQDERAWNACEQGDLDEFRRTREVMLKAWRQVVRHLELGYERVEEAEKECRNSAEAMRHLAHATRNSGCLTRMYWESTPACYTPDVGLTPGA
jgi:hypothetical protein